MKKHIISALIFTLIVTLTGCRSTKLSVADEQMARGEYFDASKTYRKIYNKLTKKSDRPLRGEVAFKMAEAHRMLSQDERAAAAYQNAIRYGYPDSTAQLRLAQSLHGCGKYAAAITAYEEFLMRAPNSKVAKTGLAGAQLGVKMKANPTRYIVKNAKLFNSRRADFAPMINNDILYFTTTNEKVTGENRSEITGMKKSDIWMAQKDEQGAWQRPEPCEGELNSELDEGIVSFSADGNTMYLTKARRANFNTGVEIFTSARQEAAWAAPVKFDVTNDTVSSFGHPSVDPSDEWLYFTSDMPGQGGKDIWRINLKERAGSLENLGESINTPGDEMFPYIYSDSTLYFASDGHPGLGGLDIFKAMLQPSGKWEVVNMGVPLNSAADDFGICFNFKTDHPEGFFSSNRGDNRGYDHLYTFELPDLKITLNGWVTDMDEEPIGGAVIRIVGNDGTMLKTASRDDGSFTFPLQRGVSYAMLAGARGFLNGKQEFTSDTTETDAEYEVEFRLASLSKPNIVENIFYDFDEASLRPESKEALDGLIEMMRDNPGLTIEMASHTDRVGTEEYNQDLSERRAKSVIDYLIEAGIEPTRLQYQGYGKSRPMVVTKRVARLYPQFQEGQTLNEEFVMTLSDEDREAADQINRRTEFQVLSVEYNIF